MYNVSHVLYTVHRNTGKRKDMKMKMKTCLFRENLPFEILILTFDITNFQLATFYSQDSQNQVKLYLRCTLYT